MACVRDLGSIAFSKATRGSLLEGGATKHHTTADAAAGAFEFKATSPGTVGLCVLLNSSHWHVLCNMRLEYGFFVV